jgi:hypothetical protein
MIDISYIMRLYLLSLSLSPTTKFIFFSNCTTVCPFVSLWLSHSKYPFSLLIAQCFPPNLSRSSCALLGTMPLLSTGTTTPMSPRPSPPSRLCGQWASNHVTPHLVPLRPHILMTIYMLFPWRRPGPTTQAFLLNLRWSTARARSSGPCPRVLRPTVVSKSFAQSLPIRLLRSGTTI